ncbi:hypothetical protein TTHERM_00204100 (macronuclear) [Tetrahymena thermophila SB210]|uniref:Uncharacterized protein n=1 Tax=Tetrahymena thermophila (strain SB210) TaxID=312017 RepID=Q22ND4_TETTS|nr:hypothetical protein TTHERM_00204100 [Tetrahymena thermophila SB210]EAR86851.2 hypothetical protein TTHERM_00204100 [Tetrahymena thermophila SB210]|eukprot:XP_001007096.2 hypothetical protein TTHERM_00204100 [Tetrahymena thermophila SB210]
MNYNNKQNIRQLTKQVNKQISYLWRQFSLQHILRKRKKKLFLSNQNQIVLIFLLEERLINSINILNLIQFIIKMFKPQSPVSLKYEKSNLSEQKDDGQTKDIDQKQLKSLEEDHTSLLKKYEQLSKTKQDGFALNSTVEAQQQYYSKDLNQRSNTPSKLSQQDQYQTAKQLMQIADYALQNEKSKEERILQQLVEDYKVTNRDLSTKLDQERQEVLDQRVKIHALETEIKFCKKENQRLTSMIENIGTKKSSILNQNIQEKQENPNESQKRQWESRILQLEEQNSQLTQEKLALQHQNRVMEERLSSIGNELEILKNIQQAMQLKDKKQAKDEINAREIEIQQLKESLTKLKNENQEQMYQYQQKISLKNTEIEKMLELNSVLQEQFLQMEKKLQQKEEFLQSKQDKQQFNEEREQILVKENEKLNIELVNMNNQVKQLNEQIQLKSSKQQIEFIQLQKDYQLIVQEKEALIVQASGQQETIQMLNQQIAILERISSENNKTQNSKKQSEEKTLSLVKKDLEDSKQKQLQQSKEMDLLKDQNDRLQKQINLIEEENQCLKMTKADTEDKNTGLNSDKNNYLQLIDQLQSEICQLNATLEENQRKNQEKQKQLNETIQIQKNEIGNLQSINAMFEKQILTIQNQLKDKKNEMETKSLAQNSNVNELKFFEERIANLQKQNDLYSQKIQALESKQQQLSRDSSQKRASALNLLEEGIQRSNSKQNIAAAAHDGEEKYKIILKNYNQMSEQCSMQLKQIDILNQTIQELQKTIKQQTQQMQKNNQNLQIPSTSDFQDYQEPSKKKLYLEFNSKEGLSENNLDNNYSPEKILIQDLEVLQDNSKLRNTTDQEKQTLIVNLQKENKRLVEKIASVELAFSQLNQKVDGLTRQNQNNLNLNNLNSSNNLPPLPYPTTPVMTQNNMIFSKQFKSSEKPPSTPLQLSNQKNLLEKDLANSSKKRHKIFEPYGTNRRHQSSDRKSPNTRYLNNSVEGNPQIQTSNYQSFNGSPSRSYQDGFGHKRQHTLPNAFNSQQNFFVDQSQINYNSRTKQQEVKRPNSFYQQNQSFKPDQKQNKNVQNEESVLLFSPINLIDKKKAMSQDDTEDLLSNGSIDNQMKQIIYPHLNVYEYYDQMQNNGSQCISLQIIKFDRSLFSQYAMSKDNLLKYKQAIFLQKIVYLETKEGLQIGCISQQERDQDQIYLNLNLYYKNLAQTPIDQLYVTLTGSSTCQAFAKPTVSNWCLSPNNQSKQELFFKFNSIPFGPIQAEIVYQCKDIKKKFQLHMPVNILKFLEQRTIQADRLLSKYLKIKLNPKNTAKLQNGFILKSEKFYLDRKFALNINDFAQYLPHFQRIPQIDKLGEFMMGGNDFQLGGSYLLRENNLIFYMILTIKTNKFAIFEIFSESNNQNNITICENILQNFVYIFINPDN